MVKRIADWLEKMSVGFIIGSFFNGSGLAVTFGLVAAIISFYLTWREQQ